MSEWHRHRHQGCLQGGVVLPDAVVEHVVDQVDQVQLLIEIRVGARHAPRQMLRQQLVAGFVDSFLEHPLLSGANAVLGTRVHDRLQEGVKIREINATATTEFL